MGWSRFSPSGFVDNDFNPLMIGVGPVNHAMGRGVSL